MRKFKVILRAIICIFMLLFIVSGIAVGLNSPLIMGIGYILVIAGFIVFARKNDIRQFTRKKLYGTLGALMALSILFVGVSPWTTETTEITSIDDPQTENVSVNKEEKTSNTTDDAKEKTESTKNSSADNATSSDKSTSNSTTSNDMFEGYKIVDVNYCSLSGSRQANVAVDIGYGDREYWAFTNEHGQLVKVVAKKIVPQNDNTEDVNSSGRYCGDEAKVAGVEASDLDEGHVIADSLGGVSNAYNITPQNSTLNRTGKQADMEESIRKAGGCTDFTAIITYPNTSTMTPSHYAYTYTLNGKVVKTEFDNKSSKTSTKKKSSSKYSSSNKKSSNTSKSSSSSNKSSNSNKSKSNSSSSSSNKTSNSSSNSSVQSTPVGGQVWISATGSKYHNKPNCGRMNPDKARQISLSEAKSRGFEPCSKCF